MLCTASALIQGKLKCFIASIKDITVLGATGHSANASRITFLLHSLCFRIKAFPLQRDWAIFSKMFLFTFEKLSANRNSKSTNRVPLNIATYLWHSGHILNSSATLSHQMTGRHFDIIQPLTLNFTLIKQKPKHTPQNTEKIETVAVSSKMSPYHYR